MKTVGISEKTHRELMTLKLESNVKNTDELLEKLLIEHKKIKLIEAAALFRGSVQKKKMSFNNTLEESRKIRDEIYAEWFSENSS